MKCEDCPEKDTCNPREGEPCQPYIGTPTEEELDGENESMSDLLRAYFSRLIR